MGVGTASLVRVTLGLGSAAGIGTAIGAPIALSVQSQTENVSRNSRNNRTSQVSISKCDFQNNQERETINFGELGVKQICGEVKDSTVQINPALAEDYRYTDLFKNMWHDRNGNGTSGTDYGATNCTQKQGLFNGQGSKSESLGLCEGAKSLNQGLIVENDDNTTIKVCAGECFENRTDHNGKTLTYSQIKGEGKQIQFKKLS